jgi:hypothetical protein
VTPVNSLNQSENFIVPLSSKDKLRTTYKKQYIYRWDHGGITTAHFQNCISRNCFITIITTIYQVSSRAIPHMTTIQTDYKCYVQASLGLTEYERATLISLRWKFSKKTYLLAWDPIKDILLLLSKPKSLSDFQECTIGKAENKFFKLTILNVTILTQHSSFWSFIAMNNTAARK